MRRRRASLAGAGFIALAAALRLGTAALTEFKPIFPAYYYNDAVLNDVNARQTIAAWASGDRTAFLAPGAEAYTLWTAFLYKAFLPAPIVPKAANAFIGAAAVAFWAAAAAVLYGRRAGLATAALMAVWPSHIFYTAQNTKEAPALLLMSMAFWGFVVALRPGAPARRHGALALAAAAMVALGFLRSHILPFMVLAAASGSAALLLQRGRPALPAALTLAAWAAGGAFFYQPAQVLMRPYLFGSQESEAPFLPPSVSLEEPGRVVRPDSPEHIAEYRRIRLYCTQLDSQRQSGREVETQLFPEARFKTWLDVALFLPKVTFYAMFMPLPGLYPMAGKLGRWLAGGENILLLAGFLAAAGGLRRARLLPGTWVLASFIALSAPAAALFEFDLGSASRHRLQTLSLAVPLAALWLSRRPRPLRTL